MRENAENPQQRRNLNFPQAVMVNIKALLVFAVAIGGRFLFASKPIRYACVNEYFINSSTALRRQAGSCVAASKQTLIEGY